MWRYGPLATVFILGPMIFSFALAMDTYMPVIPEMKLYLNTTQQLIQLTLSLYFVVVGAGQLIVGPISDQVGRFKVLVFSALLFILSSYLCATTDSVYNLIGYRVVQGVASCGLSVVAFAIVRDSFDARKSGMIYSALNAMISVSPILGPIIGVGLAMFFTWHAIFYFLTILGVITLALTFIFVRESLPLERRKPFNLSVFSRYKIICSSLQFWAFTLPATCGVTAFFVLFSMTPYVIKILDEPMTQIGVYFGMAGASYLLGSLLASGLIHRYGILRVSIMGCICVIFAGFVQFGAHYLYGLTLWSFFGPAMLATFGCALTCGSGASGALEPFGEFSGAAAAMFGALELGGSALLGSVAMLFKVQSSLPMAYTMIITTTFALMLLMIFKRKYPNYGKFDKD